jgi:glycosyltransferase involved in cell wall biosynthesis
MRFSLYYNPPKRTEGGAHTYVESLLEEIVGLVGSTKHELVIFGVGNELPARFKLPSVRFVNLRRAGADALLAIWLATALRRWRWHPFLGVQRMVEYWMQARLAAVLRRNGVQFFWSLGPFVHTMEIPYAITIWDIQHRMQGFFPEVSIQGEWRSRERQYMEMMSRAAYVIATNETGRAEVVRNFAIPAAKVIPLPTFTPSWALQSSSPPAEGLAERLGLSTGEFLLYPAQFWPHKNHIRIIEALAGLQAKKGRSFKAVFVGSNYGNRQYLERCAEAYGLGRQIVFPGFVSQAELRWLYTNAFCLVYPSMFGPENLPPLEAFALGCPVLCARYDGALDQLGDAAVLFDPLSSRDLIEQLQRMESPALRKDLVEKGRARAERWTARHYAGEILVLLEKFDPIRRCWS